MTEPSAHVELPLAGWGRYPTRVARCARPDRASRVEALGCPRGLGRSYGDAALGERVVLTEQLDRLLDFDEATGQLTAEAGVSLDEVIRRFAPRGWFPPLTPGTRFVTLGGALAADVHGKEHPTAGSFGDHVTRLVLRTPDGERYTLTPDDDDPLFAATVGGMGLTGVVEELTLTLRRVPSLWFRRRRVATADLADTIARLRGADDPYAVCWLDARPSATLGRGYVDTGDWARPDALVDAGVLRSAEQAHDLRLPAPRALPIRPPGWCLNRLLLWAFNRRTWRAAAYDGYSPLASFFYPLDAVADWHWLYGRRGLIQYQAAFPDGDGADANPAVRALLERVAASRVPCFLATMKRLGGEGRGLLSFPLRGLTVALDFKATPRALALCDALDAVVAEAGGRLYLAKDARCSAETFARLEGPRLDAWRAVKRGVDPEGRMTSDLARRLGLL